MLGSVSRDARNRRPVIENGPDLAGQLFQRERLLKKVVLDVDHIMVQYGLSGVARDE